MLTTNLTAYNEYFTQLISFITNTEVPTTTIKVTQYRPTAKKILKPPKNSTKEVTTIN